jgi:hypothetical protein
MAGAAEPQAARYSAFLSYSHADAAFVARLHRRLEAYRVPRRLRGGGLRNGRLAPVFVDRAELTSAPSLTQSVKEAIADSAHLIVVCSPASAGSAWVGREIALFRELHGDAGVLTAICRGNNKLAFHPALLTPTPDAGDTAVPLAADFRKGGDGQRLALLKLIAPMAGVRLDQLVQRDGQRQARQLAVAASASVGALAVAGSLTFLLLQARAGAAQEHDRGDQMVAYMIGDERANLKAVGKIDQLDALNQEALQYFKARSRGQLTDQDLALRAKLLLDMTEDDTERGAFAAADAKAQEAESITGALVASRPDDASRVFDHAQSLYWLGFVHRRLGDEVGAANDFGAYAAQARRLTVLDPGNPDYRLELGYAQSVLGTLLLQRSVDVDGAGALFTAAQANFLAVAKLRPNDRGLQIQIEDGDAWLAEVRRCAGDYQGATALRLKQQALITSLLAQDHHDFQVLFLRIGNDLALGRLASARGEWRTAVADFQRGHAEAEDLLQQDPDNIDVAEEARAVELFEAEMMLATPAQQRAAPVRLEAAVGDCGADAGRPNHVELATFCTILRAKLLRQAGAPQQAEALLAPLRAGPLLGGERLSERWLIDWRAELAG